MSPGPPKQFDEDEALQAAMVLFWSNGYDGTSMRDIVDDLGVSAPSLYNAFGDKRALFLRAIRRYNKTTLCNLEKCLQAPGSPLGNLKSYLRMLQKRAVVNPRRGCLINSTAVEFSTYDGEIADTVRNFFARLDGVFQRTLDRAVKAGELPRTTNTRALARFINTLVQGMAVFSKAGMGAAVFKDVVDSLIGSLK